MKLDHVALYGEDLEGLKEFFARYFDAVPNSMYQNPKTGLKTYFLSFEDGSRLEIMTRPDLQRTEKKIVQCGYIHLAFGVGSKERVDALTSRLREDGYEVLSGPRVTGDGYYESCVLGPEDNQIEITV